MFSSLIYKYATGVVQMAAVSFATVLIKDGLLPSNGENQFVGAVLMVFGIGWAAWQKYGHHMMEQAFLTARKPTNIKSAIAAFFLLACGGHYAHAQIVSKAPPATPLCTLTQCVGIEFGASISGVGSNADIIGQGLSNSVFAGGEIPSLQAGYLDWNGSMLLRAELSGGYQASTNINAGPVTGNENGWFASEFVDLGGTLSGLLGSATPITIPNALANSLMAEYVRIGSVQRAFATGWATGAGALFLIGPADLLDLNYTYVNYGAATNGALNTGSENLITLGWKHLIAP